MLRSACTNDTLSNVRAVPFSVESPFNLFKLLTPEFGILHEREAVNFPAKMKIKLSQCAN